MTQWKDPEIAAIRDLLASRRPAAGAPAPTWAERRAGMESFLGQAPPPEGCKVEEVAIGGRPGERLTPRDADSARVILYLHGGGYCIGSPKTHRALAGRLAEIAGSTALVQDYRMGPEVPFPGAVDDALAAYRQLLASHDPARIVIAGDSAGGGLTLATALAARAADLPMPAGLHVISPWANLTQSGPSYIAKAQSDPMITKLGLDEMASAYLGSADRAASLASPMFGDYRGLPPILIQVGSEEMLLSDAIGVAEAAGLANVDVNLRIWPEMIHVWHFFGGNLAAARAAIAEAGEWIKARQG
ncbi:MAG: alpha/beta hydrolase [Caulobacterales bacterium]